MPQSWPHLHSSVGLLLLSLRVADRDELAWQQASCSLWRGVSCFCLGLTFARGFLLLAE